MLLVGRLAHVRILALGLGLVLGAGCASPRQAAGVGLVVVGTLAAAAGIAASDIIETSDPSVPDSEMRCLNGCVASGSPVDALLAAGGAATVLAGEALLATDPASQRAKPAAPTTAPAVPTTSSVASTPGATPTSASAPVLLAPASVAQPAPTAPVTGSCVGPLRDPVAAGCSAP